MSISPPDGARTTTGLDATAAVAAFYDVFPYERRPDVLWFAGDGAFHRTMLNQELGAWDAPVIPAGPAIWVAGCGPIQGVVTALRHPDAEVVASDISARSLEEAAATAAELGVTNLRLVHESLLDATYRSQFDLVLCTGVVHHTADPAEALRRLAAALRPSGVLSLMVYNRFHRLGTAALQDALRLLRPVTPSPDAYHEDLLAAEHLLAAVPPEGWTARFLEGWGTDVNRADALVNPLERSYTVASLCELLDASGSGLRLAAPAQNWLDVARGAVSWDLDLDHPSVAGRYEALRDPERWHLLNLLHFERSPMLWFFVQRRDAPHPVPDQRGLCDRFLATTFRRCSVPERSYVLDAGRYRPGPDGDRLPAEPPSPPLDRLVALADGRRPMADLWAETGLPTTLATVNRTRLLVTTALNPHLVAC